MLGLLERCQGQVRIAGFGQVVGLDYGTLLKMAELLGLDTQAVAALLPFAEAGFIKCCRECGCMQHPRKSIQKTIKGITQIIVRETPLVVI